MVKSQGNPVDSVQRAKHHGKLRYSTHSLLNAFRRGLTIDQIKEALDSNDVTVLEDYPHDKRSPSSLILGWYNEGLPIHLVVAYEVPEVVTCYIPGLPKWINPRQRGGT